LLAGRRASSIVVAVLVAVLPMLGAASPAASLSVLRELQPACSATTDPASSGALRDQVGSVQGGRTAPAAASPVPEMFGFSLGEERRWVLEQRAPRLQPGEVELWTMRLESIAESASGPVAHFRLAHESRRFSRRQNIFNPNEMNIVIADTDLWVNKHGFPLRVLHRDDRKVRIVQRGHVDVRLAGNHFAVSNPTAMSYRSYPLYIRGGDAVELDDPAGVFLAAAVNPGALSLTFLAALSEPDGNGRYIAFDPAPLVNPRGSRLRSDISTPPGGSSQSSRQATPPAQLAERSLRRMRITLRETEEIEIGGITTLAYRVDRSNGGDAWIAPDGTVLRIDSWSQRSWVRLLRASEY
jgi:hypothetical protein